MLRKIVEHLRFRNKNPARNVNFQPQLGLSYSAQGLIATPKTLRKKNSRKSTFSFFFLMAQSHRKTHFAPLPGVRYSTLGRTSTPNASKIGKILCFRKMIFQFVRTINEEYIWKCKTKWILPCPTFDLRFSPSSASDSTPHSKNSRRRHCSSELSYCYSVCDE